ncbi:Hydroxyquinol 1,2-dioxygenase [compost metagenome]
MLGHLGRHAYRPAHMHYLVTAPGFQKLVTLIFVGDDAYLESDTVFGVKKTLVAPFERLVDGPTLWHSTFDFVLAPL